MSDIIKEYTGNEYQVVRIFAQIELKDDSQKESLCIEMNDRFDDITVHIDKPVILIRQSIHSILCATNFNNKDCTKLVLDELRKYLKYSDRIIIIENRLPLESVQYDLTN